MIVLMFQQRFAPLVRDWTKRQTIRPPRRRPVKVGDVLSLRRWTGLPYRSPQEELRRAVCVEATPLTIGAGEFGDEIEIAGRFLDTAQRAAMARADGFDCAMSMLQWFATTHGLPFRGVLIRWEAA